MVAIPRGGLTPHKSEVEYYHSTGNGTGEWLSGNQYFELFRLLVRSIGQGKASIEVLGDYNFTDEVLIAMTSWAAQAYDYYGGKEPPLNHAITPMGFDSPFFAPGLAIRALQLGKYSRFAFHSGKASKVATRSAGFKILADTDAGQNLFNLTSKMNYSVGSQAWKFWGRLSQAYARRIPKGSTVNVFVTKSAKADPMTIFNRFEKPILLKNNIKIKYNFLD